MSRTKMEFGITAGQAASWEEIAAMWRFLDREAAFHSAWLFDHFVPGMGEDDAAGPCFEAWTALGALAAMTSRIRLGVLVTGVTYRNPGLLAKMAATVDHISGGRSELGIGAAWHEAEHRMYGFDFPSVRERQDRLEEAVQVMRLLFEAEGPVSFSGRHYRLERAVFDPKPLQARMPIVVGGDGERRTLRTLARYGDVMDSGGPPERLRHKIEVVARHCRDAGRDPSEITYGYRGPIVVSDNAGYIDRLADMLAPQLEMPAEEVKRDMPVGSAAHVREMVERYAEVGVGRMTMLTQAPWKFEVYGRVSAEVVSAFAG